MNSPKPPFKSNASAESDAKPAPSPDRDAGGMVDEGGPTGGEVEGVESETETRRDGGMIGEG